MQELSSCHSEPGAAAVGAEGVQSISKAARGTDAATAMVVAPALS